MSSITTRLSAADELLLQLSMTAQVSVMHYLSLQSDTDQQQMMCNPWQLPPKEAMYEFALRQAIKESLSKKIFTYSLKPQIKTLK